MNTIDKLESFDQLYTLHNQNHEEIEGYKYTITACSGTGCSASDSVAVCEALQKEIERQGLVDKVRLSRTGCHGFCEQGPLVVIEPGNILYCKVSPADAALVVSSTVEEGKVLEPIAWIGRPGEEVESAPAREEPSQAVEERSSEGTTAVASAPREGPRVPVAPAARRLAREHGLDLSTVRGTGPGGRIVSGDVRAALTRREQEGAESDRPQAPGSAAGTKKVASSKRRRDIP